MSPKFLNKFLKRTMLNKSTVIKVWVETGIRDFLIEFTALNDWPFYAAFFYQQGLEKICKAYLLSKEVDLFCVNDDNKLKKRIDEQVRKYTPNHGHAIRDLLKNDFINDLSALKSFFSSQYPVQDYKNDLYNKDDFIRALDGAYMETRYPLPSYQSFKDKASKYDTILHACSATRDFSYEVSNILIWEIEKELNENLQSNISYPSNQKQKDITRFKEIFFRKYFQLKENNPYLP